MKVLLVNGSPNEKGCTYTALTACGEGITAEGGEFEIFHIGKGPVHGCLGCGGCRKMGKCVFDDDICTELADQMAEADGIIIGSPVYYAGINGALSAVLDRVFFSSSAKLSRKPAAGIVSCRRGGASAAFDRLNKYFTINQMPVVASTYWNSVHGMCPEDVLKDKEGLQVMRTLGRNMVHLIKSLEEANIDYPVPEKKIATNFSDGK